MYVSVYAHHLMDAVLSSSAACSESRVVGRCCVGGRWCVTENRVGGRCFAKPLNGKT